MFINKFYPKKLMPVQSYTSLQSITLLPIKLSSLSVQGKHDVIKIQHMDIGFWV